MHFHVLPGAWPHPGQRHIELGLQEIQGCRRLLQGLPVVHRLNPSCLLGNGSILVFLLILLGRLIVLLVILDFLVIFLVLLKLLEDSLFVLPQVFWEVLWLEMLRIQIGTLCLDVDKRGIYRGSWVFGLCHLSMRAKLVTQGLLSMAQMLHISQHIRLIVLVQGIILFRVDALVHLILLIVVLPVLT